MVVAYKGYPNGEQCFESGIEVSMPTDEGGYTFLRCPLCGELFKLLPEQVDHGVLLCNTLGTKL
jgi:hypothetical protein